MLGSAFGGGELGADHVPVVVAVDAEPPHDTLERDLSDHVISINVVRPDDGALAHAVFEVAQDPSEGVCSEASAEVVGLSLDVASHVTPRRAAEDTRVLNAHGPLLLTVVRVRCCG